MTIVASVKVRDGLILGTDSMTQISTNTPQGPQVLKAYSNARKLFQILSRPIGAMTYGLGNIGDRSIEGVVLDYCRTNEAGLPTVQEVTQGLYDYVRPLYDAAFQGVQQDQLPVLGFFVAGYSDAAPFPEEFEFMLPVDSAARATRPAQGFGASWRGATNPFVRLYKGYDPRIVERLLARGLTQQDIDTTVLNDLETSVIYDGMPVQDAVHWCSFILTTTIGYSTYEVGVPICGFPLQVATVLADIGFEWVARPELRVSQQML
jgi:hypothetical protein